MAVDGKEDSDYWYTTPGKVKWIYRRGGCVHREQYAPRSVRKSDGTTYVVIGCKQNGCIGILE